MSIDLLMVNCIGPAFTGDTVRREGIGGSELEIVQIAEALAVKGHKVVVANGVASAVESYGVRYIPFASCGGTKCRALYIERGTTLHSITEPIHADRIVIRATDIMCEFYEPHRKMLESHVATLVGVSEWQLSGFRGAIPGVRTICIAPMLGPTRPTEKVPGRFIYASAPCKGLQATLNKWREMVQKYPEQMRAAHLVVAVPGYATGEAPTLDAYDRQCRIEFVGAPTVEDYRSLIASAEGLFFVNEMTETFGNVAALAERSNTRPHVLVRNGVGGLGEAIRSSNVFVTADDAKFERMVLDGIGNRWTGGEVVDRSPEALVGAWEIALGLVVPDGNDGKCEASVRIVPDAPKSPESKMVDEGALNPEHLGQFFGDFLSLLRSSVAVGGSELGLGMSLFSLAISTRAAVVVEIGRFKGFSTLALAGAMKFSTVGWNEPKAAEQRPDVDYPKFHRPKKRKVVSIDKFPEPAARELIAKAGLTEHVQFVDQASEEVLLQGEPIDLLFIDGDHTYVGCKRDVAKFVPLVRRGGYVVLHDYFGWYEGTENGSPIKKVCDELAGLGVEHLLIDTGYASLMVFRKGANVPTEKEPVPVPPRADGKPTIGLVVLAKNENPIVARALMSCADWIDAKTVLVDSLSTDGTAELCERLGAEVHVRPYAGSLAETRNEALALAEKRTDYLLVVDADDKIEGERPPVLTHDVYDLMIQDGGIEYPRGQLIRSRIGARYVGCTKGCKMNIPHEYLMVPGSNHGGICTAIKYHRLGAVQGVMGWQDQAGSKAKYLRHAKDLLRHHVEHPDDTRTVFYVAQSFRDAGEPQQGRDWYRKRVALSMGPGDEEAWYSQLRVAELTLHLGEDPVSEFLKAYELRRTRAEPLVALAVWYRDDARKRYELAYLYAKQAASMPYPAQDHLFLAPAVYAWQAKGELAIAAHYTFRFDEAEALWRQVLAVCPEDQRPWAHNCLSMTLGARDEMRRTA